MTTGSNFSWGSPELTDLKFTDCDLAVDFLVDYYALNFKYPYESGGNYIRNGLLDFLKASHAPSLPTDYEIAQWWEQKNNKFSTDLDGLALTLVNWSVTNCEKLVCSSLGWQGNSDVAGRGMLTSYTVQAFLVMVYVPTLLAIQHDKLPKRMSYSPLLRRIVFAIQHSTATFLNASLLFCITMLSALLATLVYRFQDFKGSQPYSFYNISILMGLNSVFPPALLQVAASGMLRRTRGREFVWMFLMPLLVITSALGTLSAAMMGTKRQFYSVTQETSGITLETRRQIDWEVLCLKGVLGNMTTATGILVIGLGASLAFVSLMIVFRLVVAKIRHPGKPFKEHGNIRNMLWWISIALGFLCMWLILAWFVVYQASIERVGGQSNKEREWSFGQILALATWVPVLVEFGYLFFMEPVEALNGRLMDPFRVVKPAKSSLNTGFWKPLREETV